MGLNLINRIKKALGKEDRYVAPEERRDPNFLGTIFGRIRMNTDTPGPNWENIYHDYMRKQDVIDDGNYVLVRQAGIAATYRIMRRQDVVLEEGVMDLIYDRNPGRGYRRASQLEPAGASTE